MGQKRGSAPAPVNEQKDNNISFIGVTATVTGLSAAVTEGLSGSFYIGAADNLVKPKQILGRTPSVPRMPKSLFHAWNRRWKYKSR